MTGHKSEFQEVRKTHVILFFPNTHEPGLQSNYQHAEVTILRKQTKNKQTKTNENLTVSQDM